MHADIYQGLHVNILHQWISAFFVRSHILTFGKLLWNFKVNENGIIESSCLTWAIFEVRALRGTKTFNRAAYLKETLQKGSLGIFRTVLPLLVFVVLWSWRCKPWDTFHVSLHSILNPNLKINTLSCTNWT